MTKKLALKTETLRTLSDETLSLVNGGNADNGIVQTDSPSICIGCGPRNSCGIICPGDPGPTFPDPKLPGGGDQ